MDYTSMIRALQRPDLNPQYRLDAATLDPATLTNAQIAAIFNPALIRIYIQNLELPERVCQYRRYYRVQHLSRVQQERLRWLWAV